MAMLPAMGMAQKATVNVDVNPPTHAMFCYSMFVSPQGWSAVTKAVSTTLNLNRADDLAAHSLTVLRIHINRDDYGE